MGRVQEAIKKFRVKLSYLPALERYLETGDEGAYKKIKPSANDPSWWGNQLADILQPVEQWDDVDRRIVRALKAAGVEENLWQWVDKNLKHESPTGDVFGAVRRELEGAGVAAHDIAASTISFVHSLALKGRTTSAGRFILSLSDVELLRALKAVQKSKTIDRFTGSGALTELLTLAAPERLEGVIDDLLRPQGKAYPIVTVVKPLLERTGEKYLPKIIAAFEKDSDTRNKFHVAQALHAYDPKRLGDLAYGAARASLRGDGMNNNHGPVGEWMVEIFGAAATPDLVEYFSSDRLTEHWGTDILDAAAKLGRDALPCFIATLDATRNAAAHLKEKDGNYHFQQSASLRKCALGHLIALNDPAQDERIEKELNLSLAEPDGASVVNFLGLAGRWKLQRVEKDVWGLLQNKSKPVRSAAARALGKLGEAALPQARELLRHKKADIRAAAVALLISVGTDAALAELESRLDEESSDDVRDEILLAVAAAWTKQGRNITRKDVEARIKKSADKIVDPPASWADAPKLPALHWKDGGKLSRDAMAYLIYRQSRVGQMRADVEAAPMYEMIDRSRTSEFCRAVLQGFLVKQEAADRWVLALVGLLSDERLVPDLVAQIRDWVDHNRGKLAEYAVQALALMGSDAALLAVDAMAIRYRSKMKNVGRAAAEAFALAAEKLGITPEELGDRVVPWLGFAPGKPRIIEAGKGRIEASIGMDLKLAFKDLEKDKPLKSLPKTVAKEVLDEFKDLSANLREVVKAQVLRLENLLVRQRRWPAAHWRSLFLQHPLLLPFAAHLVWGHYDETGKRLGTFRALDDRTLTTNQDESYELSSTGTVGMVHPLELSDAERTAWQNHLADYEIEPALPQLERQVVHCTPEQAEKRIHDALDGISLNAMTFKGRAERLGWYRGSVCDGGAITSYYKSFPASGPDVFLALDGMYMGIDMYSDIKLGDAFFVKHDGVRIGSYTYDEPANEDDPRLIPLGKVPPIVFSEVMGDLQKIAGKKDVGEADE